MRKTLWLAVVAATFVACDSPMDPARDATPGPAANLVPGAVVAQATGSDISNREHGVRQLTFTARTHADGSTSGEYNFTTEGNYRQLRGTIVCMRVSGDRVFLVGDVRHDRLTDFPLPVGGVAIEAVDGGNGPGMDQISFLGLAPDTESLMEWCESGPPGPVSPLEHGHIRITG